MRCPAAGLVTGIGTIRGVVCMIIANDATTKGGSFFKETIRKHVRAQDIAFENKLPVVYLVDCGGANLAQGDEVFPDQDHFGGAFYRQCRMSASGIPQIAAVFGECTAGGAYIPALSDEVVMTAGNSSVHLGGPQIVKAAIREIVDRDTLGGAEMHCNRLRRVRSFRARRDGGNRENPGHRRRAQPGAARLWRHSPCPRAVVRHQGNPGHHRCRPDAFPSTSAKSSHDWSTAANSTNSSRCTARRWSAALRISRACRSASSPTTACCSRNHR